MTKSVYSNLILQVETSNKEVVPLPEPLFFFLLPFFLTGNTPRTHNIMVVIFFVLLERERKGRRKKEMSMIVGRGLIVYYSLTHN